MIKNVQLDLTTVEALGFFWTSVAEREKVTEKFIVDTGKMGGFSFLYNEEFSPESFRRVLSALSNKEPFHGNKIEAKFYSRNLMILEYIDTLQEKIQLLKGLRVGEILDKLGSSSLPNGEESLSIVVVPSPFDAIVIKENKLLINFFSLFVQENQLTLNGLPLLDAIREEI